MMFERFTDTARLVVVQAQKDARRLGHNYIGCEHLLLAAAAADEPASAVLRDHGVTPERIEAAILRTVGPGQTVGPLGGLDKEALASIGIDLDVVRARIEAAFGPDALTLALPAARQSRRPAWGKGPLAELNAPPAPPPRPSQRPPARRPARQRPASAGPGSPRPYPVHAPRQEDPGAFAARGERAARQLYRRPAPHPWPARPQGRHGTGDPVGPRRRGHISARRNPRPLPQGELTPLRSDGLLSEGVEDLDSGQLKVLDVASDHGHAMHPRRCCNERVDHREGLRVLLTAQAAATGRVTGRTRSSNPVSTSRSQRSRAEAWRRSPRPRTLAIPTRSRPGSARRRTAGPAAWPRSLA